MIINSHQLFLAFNVHSLYLSIFSSPPPIPFGYPPSLLLSPYFSYYFIYHVEGVVSYHIDRAERISSSNTIEHRNVDGSIQVSESLRYCKIAT